MRIGPTWICVAACLLPTTGCALMESSQEATRQTFRLFKARPSDYRDTTEEEGDEWDYVGVEARGHLPRERDPDRWFKKHLQSEKARSIERNLGVD
jgi:hypothetical protein